MVHQNNSSQNNLLIVLMILGGDPCRLASLVGITESGVGKLGWYGNFVGFFFSYFSYRKKDQLT